MTTTETEKGPKAGAYGQSDFERIAGILSLVGAVGGPSLGKDVSDIERVASGISTLYDKLIKPNINQTGGFYDFGGANLDVGNVS
jgi:hypothetical protein